MDNWCQNRWDWSFTGRH